MTQSTVDISVYDISGKKVGTKEVSSKLFGLSEHNENLVHFVSEGQRFNHYKKTATTKGRSDVRGGGRKMRKQKGGGCSRQGGRRAPHWVGGGVVFGPKGEKREFKVNKKVKKAALASVLSNRLSSGQIFILQHSQEAPRTKDFSNLLKTLKLETARTGFAVKNEVSELAVAKSARNIHKIDLLTEDKWTVYDFLRTDSVVFTEAAIEALTERFVGVEEAN